MNSKKSRSSRHAKTPSTNNRSKQQFVTKKMMTGGRFTPPTNPPDVTYMPWHPVTLVISHNGTLEFKANDILTYLRAQLDPTKRGFNQTSSGDSRFVVQYRVLTVSSWNLTGRVISLSVEDFIDTQAGAGGRDQLCGLVDTGSSLHTPAVGFQLPNSHSAHVLRTDDRFKDEYLFVVTAPSGNQCVTYMKTLYRFDGPAKHPSIISPIQEINRTLTHLSNKILKEKESSKIELILNGIKYTAEAVALVGSLGHVTDTLTYSQCVPARVDVLENNITGLKIENICDEPTGSISGSSYEEVNSDSNTLGFASVSDEEA